MNCTMAFHTFSRYIYGMIKLQNTSRILLSALSLLVVVSFSFAAGGEGDKDKEKKGTKNSKKTETTIDSSDIQKKLDIPAVQNQTDDTLVYEDWDDNGNGGGDDDGQSNGIYIGEPGIGVNNNDFEKHQYSSLEEVTEVFKKTYRVEFDIYPNPVVSELHIKPEHAPQSLQVTNIVGKVYKQEAYTPVLSVADLAAGTYFIQLVYPDRHVESRKFIKY